MKYLCYIILVFSLFTLTSCTRTQLTIDDPLALKGSWVGTMIEGENIAKLEFELQTTQDSSLCVTQPPCDRYRIFGSVMVNKKKYTVRDGLGSLGFVSSASEFSYAPYFSVEIYDGGKQLGRINGTLKSDFYEISLDANRPSEISQIPENGILKKANP